MTSPERPNRFTDKTSAREHVWRRMRAEGSAAFPFPIEGRIPNFRGAAEAARRLLEHPTIAGAHRLKVNPDSPQRPLREGTLARGIELVIATPRLAGGFRRLDPQRIPAEAHHDAATLSGAERWGEPIPVADLPHVDAVIAGSVAVTRSGRRCGKGHGYGDIEYAILGELGHPPVAVFTSVHRSQLVDDFPSDAHDLPVSVIATPDDTITVDDPPPAPPGIDWDALSQEDLDAMPVLRDLPDRTGQQGAE